MSLTATFPAAAWESPLVRKFRAQPLLLDLTFFVVFAIDAIQTAIRSEFYGFRIWGNFAFIAYSLAALHTLWGLFHRSKAVSKTATKLRSRWVPAIIIGALGMVAPLVFLSIQRLGGRDWGSPSASMTAQPEVWVIERAARLLLDTGSPYVNVENLGRAAVVDDYTPYSPAMSLFGIPRALFGDSLLTDSRVVSALFTGLVVIIALKVVNWSIPPVRSVQFIALTSFTTLTFAVAGNDLPIAALLVLSALLVTRAAPEWTGVVAAVAVAMKMTALPAVVVLLFAVIATRGVRSAMRFTLAFLVASAIATAPVFVADPFAFIDNVVRFPLNLASVQSPAGSPLPGHMLQQAGMIGHVAVLVLLGVAAAGMVVWLIARPPRSSAEVLVRMGVGLGVGFLLMPATRWGYLLYPIVLFGAAWACRDRSTSNTEFLPSAR